MEALPPQLIPVGVAVAGAYLVVSWLFSGHEEDMEDLRSELSYALRSPGHFQQFVQGLVPHRVPADVLGAIEAAVRQVLGGQAYLKLEGSAKKHTNITGSDHDYHIRVPDGWFRSAERVTRDQMEQIADVLDGAPSQLIGAELEADMGPTALKVRYQHGNICGSIDLVPLNGDYFDRHVVVEPADRDFFNNIRRQNAARALKFVAHKLKWGLKSYRLERAVVESEWDVGVIPEHDPHGLLLFKKAMRKYEHRWPRSWPEEVRQALYSSGF